MSQDVPIGQNQISLAQLNDRSREIFRQIVESYLATGEPLGSRNLSRLIHTPLSPASVRNVMADLEQLGLIFAPHTSAGRVPTDRAYRLYIDELMRQRKVGDDVREQVDSDLESAGADVSRLFTAASRLLSQLSGEIGFVVAPA